MDEPKVCGAAKQPEDASTRMELLPQRQQADFAARVGLTGNQLRRRT